MTASRTDIEDEDVRESWEWPMVATSPRARRERARRTLLAVPFLGWLVHMAFMALDPPHSPGFAVAVWGVTAVYGTTYLAILWYGPGYGRAARIGMVGWLYLTGSGLAIVTGNPGDLSVIAFAITAAALLLPVRWAQLLGLATVAGFVAFAWPLTSEEDVMQAALLASFAVGMVGLMRLMRTVTQLREAREEIKVLAVAGERARLARDLHDVLGHSLTTITLKTGLARRMLETGAGTDRVLAEVGEAEELSRQALGDIRATVSGYRRTTLTGEIVGAGAALRAAGIDPVLPRAVDDVPVQLREPFGYVLREGVTNVIRHSGATRCEVALGSTWLEVRDNGRGASDGHALGNGLSGLTERIEAVGGTVHAGPLPEGGFRLRAEVP
ncbi:sensor histidine kinase [Nonomuraea guangzhouensis]|uniref:Sensor histidine kinase n=1 Tax=Nonomuraea guangzhouensis TaxID=1291555 RepID=A0ABW4GIS3_9ACTN|nr:sensor histidine kinase [Nonomuraea guangzhouensis]